MIPYIFLYLNLAPRGKAAIRRDRGTGGQNLAFDIILSSLLILEIINKRKRNFYFDAF